jgi:polygalacturonase
MIIDKLTVDSRENPDITQPIRHYGVAHRNTDGLDIVDCQNVRISNSFINSGDDAICIKSWAPDGFCRNIVVDNCIVSSNASGIKIGTETAGKLEDIIIQDCVVYDTRGEAIGIMTVDGAQIERVNISNITMRNIKRGGIFIRLGTRNRTYGNNRIINIPSLKDVIIENIQGTQISKLGCSITGLETYRPERIMLRNINFEFDGGVVDYNKEQKIKELANSYPKGDMFGEILPAYGFYIRHVDKIVLDNVNLHLMENDVRPAIICDDVKNIRIRDYNKWSDSKNADRIVFQNVSGVDVADKKLEYLNR